MERRKWGFNHMPDDDYCTALNCDSGAFRAVAAVQVIVRAQPK
jgi:hypothetical protein